MADYLTKKNGVFCHTCFFTIDLTEAEIIEHPKWYKKLEPFIGKRDWFRVKCQNTQCNKIGVYTYGEVRPISDFGDRLRDINKQDDTNPPQFIEFDKSN